MPESEGKIMTSLGFVELSVKVARLLRQMPTFGGQKLVGKIRRRASREFFHLLHLDVIHRLRKLGMCMETGDPDQERASEIAIEFCTACALLMQQFVEVERNELHCCLKVIVKSKNGGGSTIQTWARSDPADERSDEESAVDLRTNTAWNAFCGASDGKNQWRRMCCFCCNDLTQYVHEYDNGRAEWSKFYKSKLTFPVRYLDKTKPNTWDTIGFLEFDSTRKNVFDGMPCAYEHSKNPADYRTKLENSAIFHSGAIIADSLSMCLRPYYEIRKKQSVEPKATS